MGSDSKKLGLLKKLGVDKIFGQIKKNDHSVRNSGKFPLERYPSFYEILQKSSRNENISQKVIFYYYAMSTF